MRNRGRHEILWNSEYDGLIGICTNPFSALVPDTLIESSISPNATSADVSGCLQQKGREAG